MSGEDYTWNDFTNTINVKVDGENSTVPSTAISVLILLANAVIFAILAWYLDHVLESNRGAPDPWYFFVTPKY